MRVLSLLILVGIATQASAWWCTGHILVASIAQQKFCKGVGEQVTDLIKYIGGDFEKSPDYLTAACWADDLKDDDVNMFSNFHFLNTPYMRTAMFSGYPIPEEMYNVVWAIEQSNATLMSPKANKLEKALFLRFLEHFVGDTHQPLHGATEYTVEYPYPGGDQGGNLYPITGANTTVLHAFWDSGAGQWNDVNRPMGRNDTEYIDHWTGNLVYEYPAESSTVKPYLSAGNASLWAVESFDAAVAVAYTLPAGGAVTNDYLNAARDLCRLRVALGGYRLAMMLNEIFAADDPDCTFKFARNY